MGFEPMIEFPLYTLSKRAPSTTRPPLHIYFKKYCTSNYIKRAKSFYLFSIIFFEFSVKYTNQSINYFFLNIYVIYSKLFASVCF